MTKKVVPEGKEGQGGKTAGNVWWGGGTQMKDGRSKKIGNKETSQRYKRKIKKTELPFAETGRDFLRK